MLTATAATFATPTSPNGSVMGTIPKNTYLWLICLRLTHEDKDESLTEAEQIEYDDDEERYVRTRNALVIGYVAHRAEALDR